MSDPTSDRAPEPTPTLLQLGALIDTVTETARRANEARATGKARGAVTGFPKIDREFCGALPNGLISINGGPGAGKTAFAFQVAASCGCTALFASCEMSPEELFRRHMARVNGHYLNRYKSGEMPPETVRAHAITAATAAPMLAIADLTRAVSLPKQTPCEYLQELAAIMRRQHATGQSAESGGDSSDRAPFLLVIDSLHSWAMSAAAGSILSETEILIKWLGELNQLAHALRCPVLLITERNRANMDKGGQNAGAGTRRIEYGAEAVLSLDVERDPKTGEPMADNGAGEKNVDLKFAKNRHGAAGRKVALKFNGALMRFQEA
jgi:replicative DNA helicase